VRAVWATFLRELRAYFFSPLAYVVLFFLLVANGVIFAIIVGYLNDPMAPAGRPFDYFFNNFVFWAMQLFGAPVLTMRLLAEERRSGSIEVLMTAPVTENQVVVGKYLGALTFYIFLWLPTVLYGVILESYTDVDWGPVAAGYLGLVLIGALFLSIGLFASSLTRNQLIAAIITFALLLLLVLGVALLGNLVDTPWLSDTLAYLNTLDHQEELSHGIVDTRRLVLYVSGTVFFLFLTARTLENNKWS
jgi:ABC-2 type transport system permease protein